MKARTSPSRGQALVEMAMVLPVLLLLLMGLFDFGRAIYSYNAISNAAREGGRTAIVNQTLSDIRTRAAAQATAVGIDPSMTSCDPTVPAETDCVDVAFMNHPMTGPCVPDTGAYGCIAVVTVKHTFTPLTPIIGQIWSGISMSSTTQQQIESICIDGGVPCPVR